MKTIICEQPEKLLMIEKEVPTPKEDEVLIKLNYVGICGTDIHAFNGRQPFFHYPRVLGHEISASIERVGENVPKDIVGKQCTIIPYIHCGNCHSCKRGITNACENLSVIGVHQDGAFTEYLNVPYKQVVIIENMDPKYITLIEPFSIGHHALSRVQLKGNDHIAVIGGGPIGNTIAYFAKLKNVKVTVVEIDDSKHSFIRKITGCDEVVSNVSEVKDKIDIIFDATGNKQSMENTLNVIAHSGTIVFVGLILDDIKFYDPVFHAKEISLLASRSATAKDFAAVMELLKDEQLMENYISEIISFDEVISFFEEKNYKNKTLVKIG